MRKSIFFTLAAFAVLSSCQKNELSDTLPGDVLYAEIEEVTPTKTVLDVNNNIRWSENDQVVAYMKSTYGDKYQVQPTYVGKTYANFNRISTQSGTDFSAGIELNHNLAYYPYSEDIEVEKFGADYNLNVVLPYEQTYLPESFGNGNFPMVAVSETDNFTFRNVCGGTKLQLKGLIKVTSIKIEGKNSEKLSGIATVTAYTDQQLKPSITMDSSASTSVVLNCGAEGVKLNGTTATEFIITLPPVIFTKGFTVTITDAAGGVQTIETNKSNSVIRSSLLVMPEITLETAEYVDEYGVNRGRGVLIGEAVWAPVNCGYHETDYKYGKLYQWGRMYGQGYDGNLYNAQGKVTGTYSDAKVPTLKTGTAYIYVANDQTNSNVYYYGSILHVAAYMGGTDYAYWDSSKNGELWNSGTEASPVKTKYDPCPEGWRVPTTSELESLSSNFSSIVNDENGTSGLYLSGEQEYSEGCSKIFFPFAGERDGIDAIARYRGKTGYYWSSEPGEQWRAHYLCFSISSSTTTVAVYENGGTANGFSVRCVQVTD